ncbi:MAG: hypothetical protein WBP58_09590 [Chitinophagaceae bacterium]
MNLFIRIFVQVSLVLTGTLSVHSQVAVSPVVSTSNAISGNRPYTGVIADYYANGTPKLWKTLINGKANGLWLEWYPDGTLRYRAYWKNDLGHGRWEYFHPNGKLRSESFYIEDIVQGIYRSYFDNGQLESDGTYLKGKKDGVEVLYDRNGSPLKRSFYENGRLVVDQPVLFELGKVTDQVSNVWGICFTPDGNTAYFTRRDATTRKKRIYVTERSDTGWSAPRIADFSTDEDESPYINPQGTIMFFASYRPLPDVVAKRSTDSNIWFMDKTSSGWSQPSPVKGGINKVMDAADKWPAKYEASPATDQSGNLWYATKATQTSVTNLYFAPRLPNGSFGKPVEMIELSSNQYFDGAPVFASNDSLLFFSSDNRADGLGGSDIYYAKKLNGVWTKPKNFMPQVINSYYDDGFPSFSPDGKLFFFSSMRAGRKDANGELIWDLYYIETRFLTIE